MNCQNCNRKSERIFGMFCKTKTTVPIGFRLIPGTKTPDWCPEEIINDVIDKGWGKFTRKTKVEIKVNLIESTSSSLLKRLRSC